MNSAVVVLLVSVALCSAHVHIMEPHRERLDVAVDGSITIKCESLADKEIKWEFNHKPLAASSHVTIAESHESHADQHKDHDDHNDKHDHVDDDAIDKALHNAKEDHEDDHDKGHHDHNHDDDHDHDHDHHGDHNPTGDHAGHHRISTLTIARATENDAGTYSCYEHDDKGEHDEVEVVVGSKWGAERILLDHDSTDHVHTGGSIVLVCNYYGTRANAQVTWKKAGADVPADFDTQQISKPYGVKSMLHKGKAALADTAEYTCAVGDFSDKVKVAVANSSGALAPTACFVILAVILKFWV